MERGTPLMFASRNGHREVVQLLLARGGFVNVQTLDGGTALAFASEYNHTAIVKMLLEKKAHANTPTNAGVTALMCVPCMSPAMP